MLDGIKILNLKENVDERGSFTEMMRIDWKEFIGNDEIVQSSLSISKPGIIRAWHNHERGQIDYFLVIKGSVKICAFDEVSGELDEIIAKEEPLQLIRLPGKYWHGTKNIGKEDSVIVYFHTNLYDHKNPDEGRRPWDDRTIVPKSINGKASDPKVGKPWDWSIK